MNVCHQPSCTEPATRTVTVVGTPQGVCARHAEGYLAFYALLDIDAHLED